MTARPFKSELKQKPRLCQKGHTWSEIIRASSKWP